MEQTFYPSPRYPLHVTMLNVRVTPRASRDAIEGFDDAGVLRVRVTAPPADGAANAAVARLLAKSLGLPARDVVLVSGVSARLKRFDVPLSPGELRARLT
ncbi:MAG: DUF167 domain-containing protein [Dehalococcoidia bacterium]